MHPLLDQDKQIQARQYEKERRVLSLSGSIVTTIFLVIFYDSGLSEKMVRTLLFPAFWRTTLYLAIFYILLSFIGLPTSYLSGYRLEKKWGFSNQTLKAWAWDEVKGFFVGLILTPLLLGLLLVIMNRFPHYWWLVAGLLTSLVGVLFATLFPVLILPLFNTYTPVQDKSLIDRLTRLLQKAGLKASGFFVTDMSRQTKKENAFLAGLGRTRRVVLGDTLLQNMKPEEIETVIAHEIGHHKYHHIWKNIGLGTGQQIILFYLTHVILTNLFPPFLSTWSDNLIFLPAFLIVYGILSTILFGPLNLALSRFFERQADAVALDLTGNPTAFQSAMAGLANRNLSNAYPEKWVKWLFYSHPPIGERLAFAESWQT